MSEMREIISILCQRLAAFVCVCCYFHYGTKEQAEDIVYTLLSRKVHKELWAAASGRALSISLSLSFAYRSIIRGVCIQKCFSTEKKVCSTQNCVFVCIRTSSFLCTSTCASGDKKLMRFQNSPPREFESNLFCLISLSAE